MKQFKRGLLLLLVLVFATACAHTNSGTMTSPNLDRITQSGVLRVGTAANMPPLNMLDKSGVPMGLDVDLARYMASAMGVELSLVIKPFPDLLPALEAGEVDMVISGMTITPERNMKVAFAGPYHISGKALLTRFKSLVTSEDTSKLNSEAFAYTALESSTSATLVETLMPKARLVTAKNYEDAVDMVLTNKVDALVADYHVCILSLLRHPDEGLVSLITPFTYEPLGIAMPAGDAHLMNWTTNFLNTMRESDELIKMKVKWIEDPSWLLNLK
ncbi:MAG: transporter substrate-binding domain-containing protein [Desulfosarcina sp.]|nr:transporter substrate-binding domain-containing protein [Desulfosarcina sp.]MBC2741803.1 transporter substrate-binding domain-containing protein [Desulfosarcina sp.]MBC2764717.1 transporter substrate-binding domain-containing protein [Desulfosarcina sp.]